MKYFILAVIAALAVAQPVLAQNTGAAQAPAPNPLDPPAPPPSNEPKPDWMGYQTPYNGEQNDLSAPHRTPEEIIAWVRQMATDVLTFTSKTAYERMKAAGADVKYDDVNGKLFRLKPYFTDKAWAQFATFATQSGIIDKVRNQEYSITTIMNGNALVIDNSPADGTYHWAVRTPLMISYLLVNEAGEQQPVEDGQYELDIVVGRIPPKNTEDHGLVIESWSIREKAL
ncbi:MAG TPA: DotI/IcmL family type IV secretion protein [Patescibacteria group bacterium]|nr:DotI/IcmL family type IV secretion protein [Patescibacteria group bacterium]